LPEFGCRPEVLKTAVSGTEWGIPLCPQGVVPFCREEGERKASATKEPRDLGDMHEPPQREPLLGKSFRKISKENPSSKLLSDRKTKGRMSGNLNGKEGTGGVGTEPGKEGTSYITRIGS